MDLLWLGLIVQILFYLSNNNHTSIMIFILLGLAFKLLTKNVFLSILFPMIVAHSHYLYFYSPAVLRENFKFKIKKAKKMVLSASKDNSKFSNDLNLVKNKITNIKKQKKRNENQIFANKSLLNTLETNIRNMEDKKDDSDDVVSANYEKIEMIESTQKMLLDDNDSMHKQLEETKSFSENLKGKLREIHEATKEILSI